MHTPPLYVPCGGKRLEKPVTLFRHLLHAYNQDFFLISFCPIISWPELIKYGVLSGLPPPPQCMTRIFFPQNLTEGSILHLFCHGGHRE